MCFTISSNLSGTYNAAVMAREMVLEEHPEKQICIIDSKATSGAMALLIYRARELMEADTTGDFEGICNQLWLYQAALRTCFTLENFDNLIKNGRMRPLVDVYKRQALAAIEDKADLVSQVADSIWSFAELSLQEEKSAALYCDCLLYTSRCV